MPIVRDLVTQHVFGRLTVIRDRAPDAGGQVDLLHAPPGALRTLADERLNGGVVLGWEEQWQDTIGQFAGKPQHIETTAFRNGSLQVAVTGAADCPFSPGVVEAWMALRAVSTRDDNPAEACRPFSADRDGMVLGEGAGILVIEAESHALKRGIPILAELKGYGASADSHHLTQPSQKGPALAMRRAMDDAGMTIADVDYINAHATGTEWNDKNETNAIKEVFGERAYEIPVVGNKAAFGHSIAGSGALELIGCILSLRDQVVPPTINYKVPDPECDLDYVPNAARDAEVEFALSNSFGFGGTNACLIFKRYEE